MLKVTHGLTTPCYKLRGFSQSARSFLAPARACLGGARGRKVWTPNLVSKPRCGGASRASPPGTGNSDNRTLSLSFRLFRPVLAYEATPGRRGVSVGKVGTICRPVPYRCWVMLGYRDFASPEARLQSRPPLPTNVTLTRRRGLLGLSNWQVWRVGPMLFQEACGPQNPARPLLRWSPPKHCGIGGPFWPVSCNKEASRGCRCANLAAARGRWSPAFRLSSETDRLKPGLQRPTQTTYYIDSPYWRD